VSSSGISWAICKSTHHSRQITTPAPPPPTQFFTDRMPFLPPNQERQSTEGVTTYNLQSKYNLQFTYRNRTNRTIISIRFHLPCCPVVSHFGHLPIRVAYSWLTRCLAKHTLREWANSYNAQNRAPVALIPLSVDISVSVCLSLCLHILTRYRPEGGETICPPPMAVRR